MQAHRSTDTSAHRTYFRSDRFSAVGNEWFFALRELNWSGAARPASPSA